jgi:hypothetical protein
MSHTPEFGEALEMDFRFWTTRPGVFVKGLPHFQFTAFGSGTSSRNIRGERSLGASQRVAECFGKHVSWSMEMSALARRRSEVGRKKFFDNEGRVKPSPGSDGRKTPGFSGAVSRSHFRHVHLNGVGFIGGASD